MFQLFVFHVDNGTMLVFAMEMALERVSNLMESIASRTKVPVNKQVLLVANGDPLDPAKKVSHYVAAVTEANPIFLFSKLAIESPVPPSTSLIVGSESVLKDEVEASMNAPPTYETLVQRATLAGDFDKHAQDLAARCERSVVDQQLQQQGWKAAGANLENITRNFQSHAAVLERQYTEFLSTKEHYKLMLSSYDTIVMLLRKIPVLPCLRKRTSPGGLQHPLVLLDWIHDQEQKISLDALARQCSELLDQFGEDTLNNMMVEVAKILESVNNPGMKEIKGLDERIARLQQRLLKARQLAQDQSEMAQGFHQNLKRAEHVRDASVLPDLCACHQKQLVLLIKNHRQLCELQSLCDRAKEELCANLHARLRWVMIIEHTICECDTRLLVYHENLKRIRRRLEIFEQVFETPRIYMLSVLEVLRRKSFSRQFLDWGRNVSSSALEARQEELDKREKFLQVFGNHFLKGMFKGMEDRPTEFAGEPPRPFDDQLPDVTVDDVRLIQNAVPELLTELNLTESLERSVVARQQLSQSNLSRLIDPGQNPTLVETLELRKRTKVDPTKAITVSQLHREISQEEVDFPAEVGLLNWPFRGDALNDPGFQPGSLKSLSGGSLELHQDASERGEESLYEVPSAEFEERHGHLVGSPGLAKGDLYSSSPQRGGQLLSLGEDGRPVERPLETPCCSCCPVAPQLLKFMSKIELTLKQTDEQTLQPCERCTSQLKSCLQSMRRCLGSLIASDDFVQGEMPDPGSRDVQPEYLCTDSSGDATSKVRHSESFFLLRQEVSCLEDERTKLSEANTDLREQVEKLIAQRTELQALADARGSQIEALNERNTKLQAEMEDTVKRAMLRMEEESKLQIEELGGKLASLEHVLENQKSNVISLEQQQRKKEKLYTDLSKRYVALENELQRREGDYFKALKEYREKIEAERLSFQSELEKQKAAMLLSFELEKGQVSAASGKEVEAILHRDPSVEEGVDALEWERLQGVCKKLEQENIQLRKLQHLNAGSVLDELLEAKTLLKEKEAQCESLHQTLAEMHTRLQDYTLSGMKGKLTVRDLDVGHSILLLYDETCKTYIAVTLGETKYYLRPESLKGLEAKLSEAVHRGEWLLGQVTEKEYCVARKPQNRFKLPVGTYFYRIHAKLWTM